jgi:inner membrane protein
VDNVTHTLVGLALSRAGFNRAGVGATTVLVLSANAPDSDIVATAWGALRYLEIHRGYTHSLLMAPVLAAVCVLLAWAVFRKPLRWLPLWGGACVGVASHLLLDWTNSYGIRLLLPFSSRWLHGDVSSLTDGVVLAVLALAAIMPWFAGMVSSEIGERPSRGRATAIAALVFYLVFDCGRGVLHARALEQLGSRMYAGATPLAVAALPTAFNPLAWNGIVEMTDSFRSVDVNVFRNIEAEEGVQVLYKTPFDAAIQRAMSTEPFRYFSYFARFPVWSEQPVLLPAMHATRVELTDLRFGAPGVGGFHCVALVDRQGMVRESVFTFGSGAGLGMGVN